MTSGYDFVDGDTNASDCFGHGTHVSGTVLGSTYGVAKATHAVALRVWDLSGERQLSDSIAAFDWVVAHKQRTVGHQLQRLRQRVPARWTTPSPVRPRPASPW